MLIADDEEGVLNLLATTINSVSRYDVLVARDGKEALEVARREKPDLFFLDILMPKMNGYEVCQALKKSKATAQIKVIMLTALAQDSSRQQALEAGADDYFTKPFSPTALLKKVEEHLSQSSMES